MRARQISLLAATGALVAGAAGVAVASSPGVHETTHTANTIAHTLKATLDGATALHVAGAVNLGHAADVNRTVTMVLDQPHASALAARIANPHVKPLTHAEFMARFAPSRAATASVVRWAKASGLNASVPADRALVSVSGPSVRLGEALGVEFDRFSRTSGADYTASVGTAKLPAGVKSITGLSSLDQLGVPKPAVKATSKPGVTVAYLGAPFTPQTLNTLYQGDGGHTGAGQTLAIFTDGDVSEPIKDLATFESMYKLPKVTWNQINTGAPTTDVTGDDEWDLDSQYSSGMAQGVSKLDDYNAPSLDDADILTAVNDWVTADATRQASFSAGECEVLADVAGFTSGLDTVLEDAASQGQTLFTSSGDNGAFCSAVVGENGVPAGVPDVLYPASSPYAIGVGGTSVITDGPTEISWYAGGGGTSLIEPAPAWQKGIGGSFVGVRRGVPDVALDADPNSGYDVVVDGALEEIGGTSASAPSWQGIWARVQGYKHVGFAGPVLYETEPASAFHDIKIGTNGTYVATPGWDYTTGRGTAEIANLITGS